MATWLQLSAFVTVVEEGGFTAASRQLGMSQPAVSRAVASLEKELELPLLVRQHDGVTLTEAGRCALPYVQEVVRQLQRMRTDLAAIAGQITGTLRLASLPIIADNLIGPQLRIFSDRHPRVAVHVIEGSEPEIRDWLDQGAADAGVVSLPAPGLASVALGEQEMTAVVPDGHRLATYDEVSYAELGKERFIRSTGGCAKVFMPVAQRLGVELDAEFRARDIFTLLEMVRTGLGVSILPDSGWSDTTRGVVMRPLVPRTVRKLAVAISASAAPPARAFLDQIAALSVI